MTYSRNNNKQILAVANTNQGAFQIYNFKDSGKVITRGKIDTLTDVLHPGIIIGIDVLKRVWVAHNHFHHKRPLLETLESYAKGQEVRWDERTTDFTPLEIVERAIYELTLCKAYNAVSYNCQTFVNIIVQGKASSEAIDKITDGGMIIGTLMSAAGLIFKNKTLINSGLTIAGISGATKLFSK